jgi:acyl-CoA thioester hydrolase
MQTAEISIRVRYAETDRMGLLHHANYLIYLEQARTEMLRDQGLAYRDLEDQGFFLVITKFEVKYRQSIRYDDLVTIRTTVERTTWVRIDHRYEILCNGRVAAEATSTLACVDRTGKPQALPEVLRKA